jgi:hypothetical protein
MHARELRLNPSRSATGAALNTGKTIPTSRKSEASPPYAGFVAGTRPQCGPASNGCNRYRHRCLIFDVGKVRRGVT